MTKEKNVKMFQVNDSKLKQKKKIRYNDIESILTDTLKNAALQIVDMDFLEVSLDADVMSLMKFENGSSNLLYTLELTDDYGEDFLGVYQPFSAKLYVVEIEAIENFKEFSSETIQFHMDFSKTMVEPDCDSFEVCRSSRYFRIRQNWFSFEKVLVAYRDSITIKIMSSTMDTSPIEDFQYCDVVSKGTRNFKAMHLIN